MYSDGDKQISLIRQGEKMVYDKLVSMRAFISK